MNFIHLHVHNEYSLLDGLGTAEQYVAEAKRHGMSHLALTNHGNVDGIIRFQKACKRGGIIPVLGCELYLCSDIGVKDDERYHIVALVRDRHGMTNLLKMLSIANLKGFHKRPRIDPATLLGHSEGLLFSSACVGTFVNMRGGEDLLMQLHRNGQVFLEIMPHSHKMQLEVNQRKLDLAFRHGIPLIATNDCHYPMRGWDRTQEVLLAIQRKAKWSDPERWSMREWPGLHLRSAAEMEDAFRRQGQFEPKTYLQAMGNTEAVARMCNGYTVERIPVLLPKAYGYEERDESDLLWELIIDGWKGRLNFEDCYIGDDLITTYQERVEDEFDLICRQGFQRYFLIVWELISWCKKNDIMTGPGRGSVGGSLVAYLLGITDVDPIKYGLIFARFVSPERIDLPDIDMDFEDTKRDLVRKHLTDCYGEYNVAGLSTFMTMKGKLALRDVSRVFEVPLLDVDNAAKSVEDIHEGKENYGKSIEYSLMDNRNFRNEYLLEFRRKYPDVIKYSINLEGQIRGAGQHPAAICLSAGDLRSGEQCNLVIRKDILVANWDKNDAEHMGLMKFDVLGVSVLSILNGVKSMVRDRHGYEIDFNSIPLDDPKVYSEMAAGNTIGGFQLGTTLMIRLCKQLMMREFNDIVLVNALSRPGPLASGVTDKFIERKTGKQRVTYIHQKMRPYTEETLGMIVYQEQVMWAMFELAGLSWADCDKVRKVMGKSKGTAAFQEFRQKFVNGCLDQGTLSATEAEHVWDQLATFGSYGFNKAHAVEYSLIGYWTMYAKVHWPKEFMCACLTWGGKEETRAYVDEARRLGFTVELPLDGTSLASQWLPTDKNVIYAPITAIKGVGDSQAGKIIGEAVATKGRLKGFFRKNEIAQDATSRQKQGNATVELLTRAGYYRSGKMSKDELKSASQYYDFNVMTGMDRFARLSNMGLHWSESDEGNLIRCNIPGFDGNLIELSKFLLETIECTSCNLRDECSNPIQPSFGRYNLMIVGEAPGRDEDKEGVGFVGKAGNQVLWPELAKYGLNPLMFHVTNLCKCWPSSTKTPDRNHIQACSKYLSKEIRSVNPIVMLVFAKTGVEAFRNGDGKITDLSGTTEWNDEHQCWICWCIHPASVLHRGGNRAKFEDGIRNFAETLARVGGRIWENGMTMDENVWMDCPVMGNFGQDNNVYNECYSCKIWERCALTVAKNDWVGLKGL